MRTQRQRRAVRADRARSLVDAVRAVSTVRVDTDRSGARHDDTDPAISLGAVTLRIGQSLYVEATDILTLDLDAGERRLLRWGIIEWGGPTRCTEEMAVAMGFRDVQDLFDSTGRLAESIASGGPLTALDWLRVLLATEIVWASNTMGSGLDWSSTSGISDEESLATLRSVQRKLSGVGTLVGRALGTPYRRP